MQKPYYDILYFKKSFRQKFVEFFSTLKGREGMREKNKGEKLAHFRKWSE